MSTTSTSSKKERTSTTIEFFERHESGSIASKLYKYPLLSNIQQHIEPPTSDGQTYLCKGEFKYFHYGCDGLDDVGWGCAYRSLQSMCSWILNKKDKKKIPIPSIEEIQSSLVEIGDKPRSFVGSNEWIGSMEICFAIDCLYDVPSKILHFPSGTELINIKDDIIEYFKTIGGFIMMGGDADSAAKGIAGIHVTDHNLYLLTIDPHCSETPSNVEYLIRKGFIRWKSVLDFIESSFYNLCLPQLVEPH